MKNKMKIDNKFWTIAGFVIGLLSLVFAGITFHINREKSTSLEVKRVSDIELTKPLNVDRLSSTYYYDDSIPVKHLWQYSFVITNTGEQTLFGRGLPLRNIREDALKLHFSNANNILAIELIDTNTEMSLVCDSLLLFSQWRPKEYVELRLLSDGSLPADLIINEYDIQNSTISYTKYSPEEKVTQRRFVDRFPYALYKALWWVVIIFDAIFIVFLAIVAATQYKQTKDKVVKISTIIVWGVVLCLMFAPLMWMF